ncbi:MAG: type VI secretion system ImpA family N-terminal domain-containing protein [Deltaproteobacteria bacterium]|jgi:type VI secretion system protein VasJ|nr:type VI secretion system ImpA family N-terminal domain-containing protein [Deltaproteobacteria bacterium]
MTITPEELKRLALDPLPGDSPAGRDVRLEEDFVALQAEIDRLSSMSGATGGVNWPLAQSLAYKILRESSKDILAAVYMAVAIGENEGPASLGAQAGFLADFVEAWWQTLLPPLKRLRARVNAIEWWRDRTIQLIQKYQGEPVAQEALDSAREALARLDGVLGAANENLPSIREVTKNLAAVPVAAAPPPPPTPPTSPAARTDRRA